MDSNETHSSPTIDSLSSEEKIEFLIRFISLAKQFKILETVSPSYKLRGRKYFLPKKKKIFKEIIKTSRILKEKLNYTFSKTLSILFIYPMYEEIQERKIDEDIKKMMINSIYNFSNDFVGESWDSQR